ncbi:hypothetical protein SADUNF_Sadunf02G0043200 [Salix dunnii]|uniref:SHSP domain-containing protein n=1 Tax=Salix dunnii TaxID=1413687 RepID=A0A835N620_9ROSI|nr:hypothetical protein SADUNF_Sadunf02G0043200 [Salix dunnii]
MKVHPTPKKRNNTITPYNDTSSLTHNPKAKKLNRLPHVFDRVLELPFHSDTEVLVQETPDSFRFVANSENITIPDDYQALVVDIFPGLTKIVVLKDTDSGDHNPSMDELEIDTWRCRLPATVRPEMVNARCIEGQLMVTVPKTLNLENLVGGQNVEEEANISWLDGLL